MKQLRGKHIKNFVVKRVEGFACVLFTHTLNICGVRTLDHGKIIYMLKRFERNLNLRVSTKYRVHCITTTHNVIRAIQYPKLCANKNKIFIIHINRLKFGGIQIRMRKTPRLLYMYFPSKRAVTVGARSKYEVYEFISKVEKAFC